MIKLSRLVFTILILAFVSCQSKANKIKSSIDNINTERMIFAKNLSDKMLTSQKNGTFYPLSEQEAERVMINGLDENAQKDAYKQIKKLFGDYKDLKFESLVKIDQTEIYEIYRFKGLFEMNSNVEIRAVLNSQGKLAGFFVKPWKESL